MKQESSKQEISEKNHGFTVVEVLLGAVLAGVLALIVSGGFDILNSGSRRAELSSDANDLKALIIGSVDCKTTFQGISIPSTCTSVGEFVDIKTAPNPSFPGGKILISGAGTDFGKTTVRALCTSQGLDIRGAQILPAFQSERAALTDWRNLSIPANPERYKKDVTFDDPSKTFSWAHPQLRITRPGSTGLCSKFFATPVATAPCPNGSFVHSVNFDTNQLSCRPIPTCTPPRTLNFNGTGFVCSLNLYTQLRDEFVSLANANTPDYSNWINTSGTSYSNQVSAINNLFNATLNPANDYQIIKYSNSDCRRLADMKCASGYVMTRYEFRYDTSYSQKCSINCSKLSP